MTPSSRPFSRDGERRAAGARDALDGPLKSARRAYSSRQAGIGLSDRVDRALAQRAARKIDAGNARMRGEGHDPRVGAELRRRRGHSGSSPARRSSGLPAFRRRARRAAPLRRARVPLTPPTGMNSSAMRLPKVMVPVLSSSKRVDVARRLDRAARGGDDVEADQPIHAGDADRRQQAADRRRDEADEQRDQHGDRQDGSRIAGERPQRHADDQEDDASGPRAGSTARARSASSGARRLRPARSCGR